MWTLIKFLQNAKCNAMFPREFFKIVPTLSFKQETMKFQKMEQVDATHPRVKTLFSGDKLGWTLIPWWTLINFWQNFQGGRLF